jgi:hypothetical protein
MMVRGRPRRLRKYSSSGSLHESHLLEEVSRDHFPNSPATPEEIEEFERRVGWQLPGSSWSILRDARKVET